MTEIPEHLLKRAQAAREKSADEAPAAPQAAEPAAAAAPADSRIPEALLQRSKAAKAAKAGGAADEAPAGGGAVAVAEKVGAVVAAPAAGGGVPVGAGPGGHTQRLLTVVKSGSIQDVKATPVDKVHTWPHLLAAEFVSALAMTVFVFIFSVFVHAPLLQLANTNQTPNPSKAPWYFLGLQELLTYFHPMVAGVTLPGVGPDRARVGAVSRPKSIEQARGSQVPHRPDDRAPHVLGGARADRLVLPRPWFQLRPTVGRRPVLRIVRLRKETPQS